MTHSARCLRRPTGAQAGIEKCSRLRVLYASNNRLKDWAEVERLASLSELEDLLLVGGGSWWGARLPLMLRRQLNARARHLPVCALACTFPPQIGNPLYNEWKDNNALPQYRVEVRQAVPLTPAPPSLPTPPTHSPRPPVLPQVLKRVPSLKKLDGQLVDVEEREAARK